MPRNLPISVRLNNCCLKWAPVELVIERGITLHSSPPHSTGVRIHSVLERIRLERIRLERIRLEQTRCWNKSGCWCWNKSGAAGTNPVLTYLFLGFATTVKHGPASVASEFQPSQLH